MAGDIKVYLFSVLNALQIGCCPASSLASVLYRVRSPHAMDENPFATATDDTMLSRRLEP